jgi:hypothetical protein
MQPPGPFPPQYDPHDVATVHTDELEKRRARATPATWLIAIVLAAAAIVWIIAVTHKTHF